MKSKHQFNSFSIYIHVTINIRKSDKQGYYSNIFIYLLNHLVQSSMEKEPVRKPDILATSTKKFKYIFTKDFNPEHN